MKKRSFKKKSQVTLFIIFAILIFISLISFFFLKIKSYPEKRLTINPQEQIESCIKEELLKVLPIIMEQGGVFNPRKISDESVLYEDKYTKYLCYSSGKREKCFINTPLLKSSIEEEIEKATIEGVKKCFENLRKKLAGYDYKEEEQFNYSIEISPSFLTAKVNKEITISKGDSLKKFNSFVFKEPSPLFDFILITNDILVKEVSCNCGKESCTADTLGLSNNNFKVSVFIAGNGEKVYKIEDMITKQKFKFAVRNCIP